MAPVKCLAFAALVCASSSGFSAYASPVLSENNTKDALLGINLARTGKLNGENWKVFENTQMDEDTQDAIGGLVLYAADCSIRNIQNPLTEGMLLINNRKKTLTSEDITEMLQEQLTKGLAAMPTNPRKFGDITNRAARNLAYIMNPQANTVSCAATITCGTDKSVMLCKFDHMPKDSDKPFPDKLFKAMKQREAHDVKLMEMAERDLETQLSDDDFEEVPEEEELISEGKNTTDHFSNENAQQLRNHSSLAALPSAVGVASLAAIVAIH